MSIGGVPDKSQNALLDLNYLVNNEAPTEGLMMLLHDHIHSEPAIILILTLLFTRALKTPQPNTPREPPP